MAPGASELVISEWTLISLSTAVIAARIYLRLGIQKRRLLGSDLWMTAAWAMGIVVAAFCITFIRMGVMEHGIDPSLKAYDGSKEDKQYIRKLLWISTLPFLTSFYICKSALLCVYLQVIPAFMTSRRMFLWATIGFVAVSYLITIILFFTTCTPVSRFWTLDPNRQCLTSSWMIFVRTSWALNFAGDVFIFALPWLIVPDLMVKGWLRVGIYFTFLLGLINMVISIVRFVKLYGGGNEGEISLVTIHFWNSLDLYIGLVISCLPSLRPYFNLATESRAFNYVKGKTTSRLSGHTATASTQSSGVVRIPSKSAPGPSVASTDRLSEPEPYDMDTLPGRIPSHGLGGSGKTQFCCKFAEDNRESFWGVFWIDASTSERVKHTLGAIAKTAGLEQNEKSALHWLSNLEQNWLLIIDNADDDNIPLEKYFPKGNRGNVLVTTRNPAYRMHGNVGRRWYEFRGLELDEATQLLLKASDSPAPWDEVCTSLALKITEALGALALAIVHAGTAIRENLCSLKNYLDYYSRSWRKIRNATLTEKSTASDAVVYSTWEICYNRLEQKGTEAALDALELLNMMAFLHWETIPREIFSRALRNSEQESKQNIEVSAQPSTHSSWLVALFDRLREAPTALLALLFRNQGPGILPKLIREAWQCGGVDNADDRIRLALKELVQMSLIIRNDHTDTYAMHPIVHRWARERPKMRLAEQALWAEVTGRVLAASILLPPLGTAAADEKYHISLLSHVMHVQDCRRSTTEAISNARRYTNRVFSWIISLVPDLAPDADKVRMYAKFSLIYAKCGYWKEAEELLKEVTGFLCRYLGPQHKRSRQALLFLSTVYWHLGRSSDAAMIQSSVLQTCVSHLGRSHPDTLRAMAELGRTRWQQGQYTVARDLQEEVLRELLLRLPHDSADVLEAKNNLGLTVLKFWKRHHFEQAVRLHSEAVEGMAKVHGPDHEQTLAAKEHLCRAAVLLGGEHLESVEELMTEVLETRRTKLGKEHPYTLLAMVNMAIVLTAMGQYKKAEDLVLEGLPVADRTLGRDHIGTLFGRQTHAAILLERREYAAAERILLQVAESQKHMASHRGDYHPDRLGALIELARCSFALGKIDRAVAICDEAIYGLDSISMEEHPLAISLRVSRSRMLELNQSSLIDHRPEQHSHAIFPFIFFQPRNDTTAL
ncbi:tetratricopeptide repeat domain-containing [Fusarium albosuccineum]|uniref:Tetratricopeptide repeat domain-containing n=1 Tax=Fusarium albosuccineum TaxID=1237068 RepID=A0A8H4P507_9HYPO|nr:tetratricopeptide repeat domain-containing [Fusarium albosuccineum]